MCQEENSVKQITRIHVDLKESGLKAAALGYVTDKIGSVLVRYASPGKKNVRSIFSKVKAVFHLRVPRAPFRVIDLPSNSEHTQAL